MWKPAVVIVFLAACASPRAPEPPRVLFELHSDPWSNLHQRLIAEATANPYWHDKVETCGCGRGADGQVLPAWAGAVEQYRGTYGARKEYYDGSLMETSLALALAGTGAVLPKGVDADLATSLTQTFPLYVAKQWPVDDARNRVWIAKVEPLVAKYGPGMAEDLAKYLEGKWPRRPIRVEVTEYAGFGGAYTTADSAILTTMSSEDAGYAVPGALEMLFHEAAHGLTATLTHDLQMTFIARGKRPPRSLDHAIIFYTAGALAKRRLGPAYVPYAYKEGVWKRGWESYEVAMRTHWQKWLDDEIDLPTALERLADALPGG